MAETANIAKMAEILSQDVFAEFQWQKIGPLNQNIPCLREEQHGVKTHPTDIVFYYDEPYSPVRTYVNVDLKSYAAGSISVAIVRAALESLAKAITCAEISQVWQERYVLNTDTPEICGMLFIYNHDGEYDRRFNQILAQIKVESLDIPKNSKIVVLGPQDVFWINNVMHEIAFMRGGRGILPAREFCRFEYPHLVRKKKVQLEKARAATLEMLTAPWILLSFVDPKKSNRKGFVLFCRRSGETVEEFLYLLDYLMHYQILVSDTDVYLKFLEPSTNAAALFDKAKAQYLEEVGGAEELKGRLATIVFGQMNEVRTKFSDVELGMM